MRHVAGLLWAQHTSEGPFGPQRRKKGAKGAGLGYERKVAKALPQAIFNPWFEYMDANGKGFAQPDFLLPLKGGLLAILECKLTATPVGKEQLALLYMPLAQFLWPKRQILGVMVTKNLTWASRGPAISLEEALQQSLRSTTIPTLHWLGHSPLLLGDFEFDPDFRVDSHA